MKKQKGSVLIILLVILLLASGGYWYWKEFDQKNIIEEQAENLVDEVQKEKPQNEDKVDSSSIKNTRSSVPIKEKSVSESDTAYKKYDNGFYYFEYPSDWVYAGDNKSVSSIVFESEDGQRISAGLGFDFEYDEIFEKYKSKPGQVSEIFINGRKYIKYESQLDFIFVTMADEKNKIGFFLSIDKSKKNNEDYLSKIILDSVEFDLSKSEIFIERWQNTSSNASILALVANFRGAAEKYFYNNNGKYSGVCDMATDMDGEKLMDQILSIVPQSNVVCKASDDKWVISVKALGDIWTTCSDYTFFNGQTEEDLNTLSCNQSGFKIVPSTSSR